jgi:predicted GH43/DUF377 family glycosyl hydrolase
MTIEKLTVTSGPDIKRVALLYFNIGGAKRVKNILKRIDTLSDSEAERKLAEVITEFGPRHRNFDELLDMHCIEAEKMAGVSVTFSQVKRRLAGAYFSKEYSVEASSLFNPSAVIHPDQSGLDEGSMRFVMSLRATGEGHISSIEFRSGIIDGNCNITLDTPSRSCVLPKREYTGGYEYKALFDDNTSLSERVLFPFLTFECMGMEDLRLVHFQDEGISTYYGIYTAYDGFEIRQQMLETSDFREFSMIPLRGAGIKDKGMSLFPRKINGKYMMSSRQDGENLYIMTSDDLTFWEPMVVHREPEFDWEFVQIGNCGSPIETEAGWILLTHAVGPCRKYVMSALLLDSNNPTKILGSLSKPLLSAEGSEREGYVPNVVYSCGAITHKGNIIIPYAQSDSRCAFAKVDINELLIELKKS